MSQGVNSVELIGFLEEKPAISYSSIGARMEMVLVTKESWVDKTSQQQQERLERHAIVAFGEIAEQCAEMESGQTILVIGQNRTRVWVDESDLRHRLAEVLASKIVLLSNDQLASTVNRVLLVGNLGEQPRLHYAVGNGGLMRANFRIATTQSWYDAVNEEFHENTEWHNVVIFGDAAEYYATNYHLGALVFVEGRNRVRKYRDQALVEHRRADIICENTRLLHHSPNALPKYLTPSNFELSQQRAEAIKQSGEWDYSGDAEIKG